MRTTTSTTLLFSSFLFVSSFFATYSEAAPALKHNVAPINRSSFPKGFVFGTGSAAYQYEGAAMIEGKGPSIWDTFAHQHPEKIWDRSTGDVADDMYHLYKEDVDRMKTTGLDAFRFSISWSRVLPKGKISGGSNPAGVKFYNNLINDLLSNGLVPYVTLFHWDLPQALEDEYTGFRSEKVVDDFRDYAEFCFKTFGDRVKHWFTLNEPFSFSMNGYAGGTFAPGRCSSYIGNCAAGDSSTEPYVVGHNLILAHGAAVKLYREKYKKYQKGEIGVTLVTHWFVPLTMTTSSERAARRALDFYLGWFLHPMTHGDYPITMRGLVGSRLPKFTPEQTKLLTNSYDFLGINYYSANYASSAKFTNSVNLSITTDHQADLSAYKNGVPIGPPTDLNWLYVYPRGIRDLMLYIKNNYGNPPVFITENGMATSNNESIPLEVALQDKVRIEYFYGHLSYLLDAIKDGANVKGFFQWTFLDDFEWDAGYSVRFGMYYVDFKDKLKRYPKYSALWFKKFLHT